MNPMGETGLPAECETANPEQLALTNRIINAAIAVHRAIGPGMPESVYEAALALEFEAAGLQFERQWTFDVVYRNTGVGTGRTDFLVERSIVLELKAVEQIHNVHIKQVVAYLKGQPPEARHADQLQRPATERRRSPHQQLIFFNSVISIPPCPL